MVHTTTPFTLASNLRLPGLLQGLLAMLVLVLISFGTSVRAADGPYIGISSSLSLMEDSDVTALARDPSLPLTSPPSQLYLMRKTSQTI